MAFVVIYDANVLYPNTLRDLLIRIAQQPHLVQAKWTDQIIDETLRALQKNRPDITQEKAARLLAQWDIRPKSPDNFVRDVMDFDSQAVWACVQQIVDSRIKRPVTIDDVLGELQRDGLVASAAALRSGPGAAPGS